MGEPELRSDEKVLVRTPGVYVKSIPFEGILTNKRIILIDRAKNLLPPKEIPLVTIKEVETGENAIRDQIITLSVMAKTGEIRQMILTFSRQAGGNRIKERDAWVRIIRENASSSYDQVIRKVIPSQEPAPRRSEPSEPRKYEVIHSPVRQPVQQHGPSWEQEPEKDTFAPPVRRPAPASPAPAVTPAPAARPYEEPPSAAPMVFCLKCGNRVPAESVFCNRCGSPVAKVPQVSHPNENPAVPRVSPSVQAPAASVPVARAYSARPIDQDIQSIEPLIERSTDRVPPDPLRAAAAESRIKQTRSWYDEGEPEESSLSETTVPGEKTGGTGFVPQLFSANSPEAATPAPSYGDYGEAPLPPKPPRGRSLMPEKKTIFKIAAALVVLLVIAAVAIFVVPMLTSGGLSLSSDEGDNPSGPATTSSSNVLKPGTIVIKETPAVNIPPTGGYVHVTYLGGFKGYYGTPDMITNVPGNSGERIWEVENATNSTVTASFEKLDGSAHELLVEIYKNGRLISSGTTTVGHGSVTLSVDMVTEKAADPVTSGSSSSAADAAAMLTPSAEPTIDNSVYESGG